MVLRWRTIGHDYGFSAWIVTDHYASMSLFHVARPAMGLEGHTLV